MFIFCEPENLGQVGKENAGQIELGTVAELLHHKQLILLISLLLCSER